MIQKTSVSLKNDYISVSGKTDQGMNVMVKDS